MALINARSQYLFLATLIVLTILPFQASCRPIDEESMVARHEEWMAKYGRVYKDGAEKEMRFKIFKDNVEIIEAHNKNSAKSYTLSVNQFADLTREEFRALYACGLEKNSNMLDTTSFDYENVAEVPPSLDWRKKGAVTPIKSQMLCGSCWAFAVVGAVEGITKIKTGKLISLSEQQLVDCDTVDGGCHGGYFEPAFDYIKTSGGLTTEEKYPYEGKDGPCRMNKNHTKIAAKIKGHKNVPANNETALLLTVVHQPVSVAVDSGDFYFYSGGVFDGNCTTNLNHGMTLIGYGVKKDGSKVNKYWLLKNSWGNKWGEKGYIKIKRDIADEKGLCGIAMMPSYPIA